jgi:hypothetical protein
MSSSHQRQSGIGAVAAIIAFVALGVIFLILFFLTSPKSSNKDNNTTNQSNGQQNQSADQPSASSSEPAYIRIPANSKIYKNSTYNFSFAYPESFGELTETSQSFNSQNDAFHAESARVEKRPVGIGTAYMTGNLGVYLYKKDDFKIVINAAGTFVAPTKTGNDITWKIVDKGATKQDISVGNAYQAKSIKSQTGIKVFDFTYKLSSSIMVGRYVFELKDNYAIIAMPNVFKPDNSALSDGDVAAYNIIGANIARTVRIPPAKTN